MHHAGSSGAAGLPLGVTRNSTKERLKQSQIAASEPARVHGQRACKKSKASQLKSLAFTGRNHPFHFQRQASRTMIASAGSEWRKKSANVTLANGWPVASANTGMTNISSMNTENSEYQSWQNTN